MEVDISHHQFSNVVGRIYDCALDPQKWDTTLHSVKEWLECEHAFLHLHDLVSKRSVIFKSAGIEPVWLERQTELAPEVTEILGRVLATGHSLDEPSAASRFMTPAELSASKCAQEWGRPQGLVDYMALFLLHSPTRLASLGLARHERQGLMSERQFTLGRQIIPHLRRCVTISNVLDARTIERERDVSLSCNRPCDFHCVASKRGLSIDASVRISFATVIECVACWIHR